MKKLISMLLLLVMLISALPAAMADPLTLTEDLLQGTWSASYSTTIKEGKKTITKYNMYFLMFWSDGSCVWLNTGDMNAQETVVHKIIGNAILVNHNGNEMIFTLVESDGQLCLLKEDGTLLKNSKFTEKAEEKKASTSMLSAAEPITVFENDRIIVEFNGFKSWLNAKSVESMRIIPNLIIANKTNDVVKFKIDWKQFYLNSYKIQPMNTNEVEVPAKGKTSLHAASTCVINTGDFLNYGENVIDNVQMTLTITHGKSSETINLDFDCSVDVYSLYKK